MDSLIKEETLKQVIEEDRIDNENDNNDVNPNQSMIINDFEKIIVNFNTMQRNNSQYLVMLQIMFSTIGIL